MSDGDFFKRVGTASPDPDRPKASGELIVFSEPEEDPAVSKKVVVGTSRKWARGEGDIFFGATETFDVIPAGFYTCRNHPSLGFYLAQQKLETDGVLDLPDTAVNKIVSEFEAFWKLRPEFVKRKFLQKRGYLLHGPPGSGKSMCINILVRKLISDHNGIVIMGEHPGLITGCLRLIRQIETERPIIVILEDFDALVEKTDETAFLSLLDGEAQVNDIVFVASTNYPERLDARFVDRPSRFDTIQYVGMPSAKAREAYLRQKEPSLTDADIKEWVRLSDGFSIAHLKEMIIAVCCFKQGLRSVVERLEEMHERKPTSEDNPDKKQTAGFLSRKRGNGKATEFDEPDDPHEYTVGAARRLARLLPGRLG